MHIEIDCPDHGIVVEDLLEGCVLAAQHIIAAGVVPPFPVDIPSLRFIPEQGTENWLLPHQTMKAGGGDCEDLAIWTAGGYRATGMDPGACCRVMQTGDHTLHCVVQMSDGSFQDPSLVIKQRARRAPDVGVSVSGWPIGDMIVREHRGSGGAGVSSQPPAAANPHPTATPQLASVLRYMADQGMNTLTIAQSATDWIAKHGGASGDLLQRGAKSHPQWSAWDRLQYERSPSTEGFGKPKSSDQSGDGLMPYSDDQGGTYWARPTQDELAMQDPYSQGYGDPYFGGAYGADPYGMFGYGGYPFAPQSSDAFQAYEYMAMAMQPAYRDDNEGYAGYGSSASDAPLTYADLYLDEEEPPPTPNVLDVEGREVDPAARLEQATAALAADAQGM